MDCRVKPGNDALRGCALGNAVDHDSVASSASYGCTHMKLPACFVHCGPRSPYSPGGSRIVSPVNSGR